MIDIQWEYGVMGIPLQANFVETLNQAGTEGWEAWSIVGQDNESVRIAVKRHKRKVLLSTDVKGALNS
jgi:hypothetical protein